MERLHMTLRVHPKFYDSDSIFGVDFLGLVDVSIFRRKENMSNLIRDQFCTD